MRDTQEITLQHGLPPACSRSKLDSWISNTMYKYRQRSLKAGKAGGKKDKQRRSPTAKSSLPGLQHGAHGAARCLCMACCLHGPSECWRCGQGDVDDDVWISCAVCYLCFHSGCVGLSPSKKDVDRFMCAACQAERKPHAGIAGKGTWTLEDCQELGS